MHKKNINTIYTIGHSTRSLEDFVELLRANKIDKLIDIRSFPGSRKYPQFNKESLATSLPQHGIMYEHKVDLGGRRKVQKDSKNNRWHNESFRGYADYMETDKFEDAIRDLEETASQTRVAIMCTEAGKVSGKIIKVHKKDFKYKGYTHHASDDAPQYEIKSDKTDHIAAYKGSALTKI